VAVRAVEPSANSGTGVVAAAVSVTRPAWPLRAIIAFTVAVACWSCASTRPSSDEEQEAISVQRAVTAKPIAPALFVLVFRTEKLVLTLVVRAARVCTGTAGVTVTPYVGVVAMDVESRDDAPPAEAVSATEPVVPSHKTS